MKTVLLAFIVDADNYDSAIKKTGAVLHLLPQDFVQSFSVVDVLDHEEVLA